MLNNLLRHHKKTVFFSKKGGNSVAVILKPKINDEGYPLRGYTNFNKNDKRIFKAQGSSF